METRLYHIETELYHYVVELIYFGGKYNDEQWNLWKWDGFELVALGGFDYGYHSINPHFEEEIDMILGKLINNKKYY